MKQIKPMLEEVKKLFEEGSYGVIPVSMEIMADSITPIEVLRILQKASQHVFLLESAEENQRWGRYSFLGFQPIMELTCRNGEITVKEGMQSRQIKGKPQEYIRQVLAENKSPILSEMPPFTGGFVGYFAYDYIKYSEPSLKLEAEDTDGFQDVDFMLFDKVICFDHYRQKICLIKNMKTENLDTEYELAGIELENLARLIQTGGRQQRVPFQLRTDFTPLFSKEHYCRMVEIIKHHIKEGDIFQAVLSNRLEAEMEGSLLDVYRVLRTSNPSPYMFYFSGTGGEIAGASPETLVKMQEGKVFTFPLAGTRGRGRDEGEDRQLEEELLADEKELAEHNMLVDLGRNDIGKISETGSVKVEKYLSVERFSHVMHIGSTISGVLRKEKDAMDVIDAILPAGTLSGAPKLRACEIINELENNKRGIYGGAIGYVSFTGTLDTCIAIRLAFSRNGKIFIRSGAGIVADSVPEKEFAECIQKAAAVLNAAKEAAGGMEYDIAD